MTVNNTSGPRPDGRHFADGIFKCIFLNENVWIPIKISLKFVPNGPINNIPATVQIMAWRRPGDKPLSEPMVVSLSTHICVARPQWVNMITFPSQDHFCNSFIGLGLDHLLANRWKYCWLYKEHQELSWGFVICCSLVIGNPTDILDTIVTILKNKPWRIRANNSH